MTLTRPQAFSRRATRWRVLTVVGALALTGAGCQSRSPQTTGSVNASPATTQDGWRRESDAWGQRFEANPADPAAAVGYARALRALGQHAQAVAVLQKAAIRNPHHLDILAAYGKALADTGRYKEAAEVLSRAHLPERPDWRILSAQGAVADQMDDHKLAQQYYEAALRLAPNEPGVMSNLGLSYALAKRLPEAEQTLRQAAALPGADRRVRQNLALVLGLQGKFPEAEQILRRDLGPAESASTLSAIRAMVSQPNSWNAIRRAAGQGAPAQMPPAKTSQAPQAGRGALAWVPSLRRDGVPTSSRRSGSAPAS